MLLVDQSFQHLSHHAEMIAVPFELPFEINQIGGRRVETLGQQPAVVGADPDAVGPGRGRPEEAELVEVGDDTLAVAAVAVERLVGRLDQVDLDRGTSVLVSGAHATVLVTLGRAPGQAAAMSCGEVMMEPSLAAFARSFALLP